MFGHLKFKTTNQKLTKVFSTRHPLKIKLSCFVDDAIDDSKPTETVEDDKVEDVHKNGEVNGDENKDELYDNEKPSSFTSKK